METADQPANDVPCSPAVGPDGTIYIFEPTPTASAAQPLSCSPTTLTAPGSGWRNGNFSTSISIGGDGTIHFGSGSSPEGGTASVFALNPDGTLKWQFDDTNAFDVVRMPVAIGLGQCLYAGDQHAFFALGP